MTEYIIDVIEKKQETKTTPQESEQEKPDTLHELSALQSYIQKTFHSKPAIVILEKCINEIGHKHKNKLVNISTESNENQKKYTIEIIEKKDNDSDQAQESDEKEMHKKKRYFPPRHGDRKRTRQ